MDRSLARRILLAALAIGVLAEVAWTDRPPASTCPILTAATLAAAWLLRRPGRAPDPLDAWLPVSALVLAGFVAVRADPFVALPRHRGCRRVHGRLGGRVLRARGDAAVGDAPSWPRPRGSSRP